jgi:hypothetical protein
MFATTASKRVQKSGNIQGNGQVVHFGLIRGIIHLRYYSGGRRFTVSTGQKIDPAHWNEPAGCLRKTYPKFKQLDQHLKTIASEVERIHLETLNKKRNLTAESFKAELLKVIRLKNARADTFVEWVDDWIVRSGKNERRKQQFKVTLNHLKSYPGVKDFDDITPSWVQRFKDHMESGGAAVNYVAKQVRMIKQLMNEATAEGVTSNYSHRSTKFKVDGEAVQSVYLTLEELKSVRAVNLPPYLDNARRLFLLGCYTGLRYSDFSRLKAANVSGGLISIRQSKTGADVVIPVHPVVGWILSEGLPRPISNQVLNRYVKEICRRAGIVSAVVKSSTKGGKKMSEPFKKYELVVTHTARRSFATNAFLSGVPAISIMRITGHGTDAAFMRYIKVSGEENARNVAEMPFFKGE